MNFGLMYENIVEPERLRMTMWCMRIACWIPKATNTHSRNISFLLLFHCNSVAGTRLDVKLNVLTYLLTYLLTYIHTYLRAYLLTYSLTPCTRFLLDKLTGLQLVKKFPAFYWTRRFITAFTIAHHLSLSSASPIQSIPPHPTSWRSILILSSHLRLGLLSGVFPSGFPTKTLSYARIAVLFIHGSKALVGLGLLREVRRSHSFRYTHSVGLPWTSDWPATETSAWQQTPMFPAIFEPTIPASDRASSTP
jgi:hypothetical protein